MEIERLEMVLANAKNDINSLEFDKYLGKPVCAQMTNSIYNQMATALECSNIQLGEIGIQIMPHIKINNHSYEIGLNIITKGI